MKLTNFVEKYIASRDISDSYSEQLRAISKAFSKSTGFDLSVADLQLDLVNQHLKRTRDVLSPETRKSHRRVILTLWQAAADEGLLPDPPRRKVMNIRVPDKIQRAWTPDDVRSLVAAATKLKGYYQNDVRKRLYWRSYVLGAWDSGLRGCDMRRVPHHAINDDGWAMIVQHKTGKLMRLRFRPETVEAIHESFPPDRELIWPLWGRLEVWRREAKRLVTLAGLQGTGSIGQLRHSSGTAVEMENPGRGHEHLGNTRAVFERHYLDHEKVALTRVMPVRLV